MELFNLGPVSWQDSQLIYHALGELNREALVLLSPSEPYVCIGYHQDVGQEVDLEYCQANQIPVFRREVGGGAVFLDGRQLFFQLILRRDNPAVPLGMEPFYRKFLAPVIKVHHRLGVPAEYRPINDLVVGRRKISGTGAGDIGDCAVFVGNLILDFDYETMSRVLKVPDEKFRDKVYKSIKENLTTINRELGVFNQAHSPDRFQKDTKDVIVTSGEEKANRYSEADLNEMLADAFAEILGPMKSAAVDGELVHKMGELKEKMLTDTWLHRRGKRVPGRVVKVRAGLEVRRRVHKAPGGLIRADYVLEDGRLHQVSISGDFFVHPRDTVHILEQRLDGLPLPEIEAVLTEFLNHGQCEVPGVAIEDWLSVFKD